MSSCDPLDIFPQEARDHDEDILGGFSKHVGSLSGTITLAKLPNPGPGKWNYKLVGSSKLTAVSMPGYTGKRYNLSPNDRPNGDTDWIYTLWKQPNLPSQPSFIRRS